MILTIILALAPPSPQAPRPAPPPPAPLPPVPAPPHVLGPARGGSYDDRARANRAIENDVDRGAGRISDESRFQLDQLDRLREIRAHPFDARLRRELFDAEVDRSYRIDVKQLAETRERKRTESQQRDAEMRLKEYELFVNAGIGGSPVAEQAERDRMSLQEARTARDQKTDAARGTKDFDQVKRDAEVTYQRERARILGFAATESK